jgi:hypothetical protein
MKITDDLQIITKWLKSIDDDSFIDSVEATTPTCYIPDSGIYAYGAKGTLVITIINTNSEIPGIILRCSQVSLVNFSFNCELEVFIEYNLSEIRIYLNGKETTPIICESIEAEILDTNSWQKK